jgi:hypothetical protein
VYFRLYPLEAVMPSDFPVNGDIIFTSDDRLVLATQTLLRGRRAKWSHVMITISQAGALHSIPKTGVTIEGWDALFAARRFGGGRMKVYRSPKVDYLGLNVLKEAETAYKAKYNSVFMFRNFPGVRRYFLRSFFCSELAAAFLSKHGVGGDKLPMRIFPIDLAQMLESQGWIDVSHIYERVFLDRAAVSECEKDMLLTMCKVIDVLQMAKRQRKEVEEQRRRIRVFTSSQIAELDRTLDEIREMSTNKEKRPHVHGASPLLATLAAFWRRIQR